MSRIINKSENVVCIMAETTLHSTNPFEVHFLHISKIFLIEQNHRILDSSRWLSIFNRGLVLVKQLSAVLSNKNCRASNTISNMNHVSDGGLINPQFPSECLHGYFTFSLIQLTNSGLMVMSDHC